MQNNSLYKYKVILIALSSSLVITGVGFIDNHIINLILAGIGTLAYAIVGVLYSLNLIHGKNAGKEAFTFIFIILLLLGLIVYNGVIPFTHWLVSWPLWCKILAPSLLVLAIIVTLIMRYNMKLFKKIIKSKYLYISLAFIVGLLLTILFSRNIYNSDIWFGVGSGIFGSAFVTLLIEILYDIRENRDIKERRKLAFENIKADICMLLSFEVFNFSSYCSLYSEEKVVNCKFETIENIMHMLFEYVNKIHNYICEDLKRTTIIADDDWYLKQRNKKIYLCQDALPTYERLLKNINKIIENKDVYTNLKIIDREDYGKLASVMSVLQFVVVYSRAESKDNTIEHKKMVFEQFQSVFDLLKINKNDQINIRY